MSLRPFLAPQYDVYGHDNYQYVADGELWQHTLVNKHPTGTF